MACDLMGSVNVTTNHFLHFFHLKISEYHKPTTNSYKWLPIGYKQVSLAWLLYLHLSYSQTESY